MKKYSSLLVAGNGKEVVVIDVSFVVLAHPPSANVTLAAMSKEEYFFIILSRCYVKSVNIIPRAFIKALTFIDCDSEPNVKHPRLWFIYIGPLALSK